MKMPNDICMQGGCAAVRNAEECKRCGFNPKEHERRCKLPLVKGENGLHRKYVGRKRSDNNG